VADARELAGNLADFPEGSITAVKLLGQDLGIVCREGEYFAQPDRGTHQRFPLHDGELTDDGEGIRCIRHGATFNLRTGRPTMPAIRPIRLFQTEVAGDELFVRLQSA
jgi:3-phenylpropionate/trans-cinnamate dioxygenase ferredoxin subunit